MSGNLSDVAEALVRKWMFSDSSALRPTQWFMALYIGAPNDAGGGTEVSTSGTGYARQEVTFDANGAANTADVVFGPALTAWGDVTHGAIFDENGRFLAWASLSATVTVTVSKQVTLTAGAITTEFD